MTAIFSCQTRTCCCTIWTCWSILPSTTLCSCRPSWKKPSERCGGTRLHTSTAHSQIHGITQAHVLIETHVLTLAHTCTHTHTRTHTLARTHTHRHTTHCKSKTQTHSLESSHTYVLPHMHILSSRSQRHRDVGVYTRARGLASAPDRHVHVFTNEHFKGTYIDRLPGESPNDRNDRAIRVAAKWYVSHFYSFFIFFLPFKSSCNVLVFSS